jgi:hypothetical protein
MPILHGACLRGAMKRDPSPQAIVLAPEAGLGMK